MTFGGLLRTPYRRSSQNSSSRHLGEYGLHLLEAHADSFSVVLFTIVIVFFARDAGRQDQGSHCNSTHPKHPPQEIPSTQLFAGHKSTPLLLTWVNKGK